MIYLLGMPARVVIGTSLVMILSVSAGNDDGPCADHPRGRYRPCRPAARRRRHRCPIWRAADHCGSSPTTCAWRSRSSSCSSRCGCSSACSGARTKSSRSSICERAAAPRSCVVLLAPLLIAADKPVLVPDVSRAPGRRFATASPARSCCCSARSSIPAAAPPTAPADIAVVLRGPVQPILVREKQKIAGIWMNADSNRFRSAPSFYAVASSRPIARARR